MRTVPTRFIAFIFAVLCASPFTAPFQTWVLAPVRSHDVVAFTSADGSAAVEGDSAALSVQPLDTRAAAAALANTDAALQVAFDHCSMHHAATALHRHELATAGPPQAPPTRALSLRL